MKAAADRMWQDARRGLAEGVGHGEMCSLIKKLAVAVIVSALLMPPTEAQPFPESDRQKAAEARKKADEKATDEAYKAMMKNTPNANKKVDPWGSLRAPAASPDK
jgi:hypothetical protein